MTLEEAVELREQNERLKPFSFLFEAYEPHVWWFEVRALTMAG